MTPAEIAAFALIQQIILNGPGIINEISAAWIKEDPTAEDFDVLVGVIDSLRPKDPLGKV